MSRTLLLFPHQLFDPSLYPDGVTEIVFIEDSLFFGDKKYHFNFNKNKLVFHRATIDDYLKNIDNEIYTVNHYPYTNDIDTVKIISDIQTDIIFFDVADFELQKRIIAGNMHAKELPSPMFLNTKTENTEYFHPDGKKKKQYRMHNFYQQQRKKLQILVDADNNPVGGKWSFDEDNRKKVPTKLRETIPQNPRVNNSASVVQAKKWVNKNFENNYGSTESFCYPTNHRDAQKWLDDFIVEKYANFGNYEDAIDTEYSRLWHSMLSPLINCGLLTPHQVINAANKAYQENNIPINSHEGFIRQIIGWREYMKALYDLRGTDMRNSNDWNQKNTLSSKWYTGSTGLPPVDKAINDVLSTGYNHHIERLMVIGNAMFLSGIHPDQVYQWFMEMYIDAYDWVMVGNVYGMSQDSLDGLITTKPYFSGSNYIFKMSNYKKSTSSDWSEVWDALYWSFIIENANQLRGNIRWAMMVRNVEKMDEEKVENYLQIKKDFLQSL